MKEYLENSLYSNNLKIYIIIDEILNLEVLTYDEFLIIYWIFKTYINEFKIILYLIKYFLITYFGVIYTRFDVELERLTEHVLYKKYIDNKVRW